MNGPVLPGGGGEPSSDAHAATNPTKRIRCSLVMATPRANARRSREPAPDSGLPQPAPVGFTALTVVEDVGRVGAAEAATVVPGIAHRLLREVLGARIDTERCVTPTGEERLVVEHTLLGRAVVVGV